jgi:ubiquitin carboxyl-terminal hydrolase MINDY-3/4
LIGRAYSNVFDGTERIPSADGSPDLELHGVPARASVGFLSLFEAFGYLKVGSFYKKPLVPCWVVSSESHYSALFAAPRGIVWPDDCYEHSQVIAAKRRQPYVEPSGVLCKGLVALRGVGSDAGVGLPLDLIYFDGLGRQEAVCRLTVSPPNPSAPAPSVDDSPPLESIIRTLWPGSTVAWNGTDPLL